MSALVPIIIFLINTNIRLPHDLRREPDLVIASSRAAGFELF
jgi:hypothetical protein